MPTGISLHQRQHLDTLVHLLIAEAAVGTHIVPIALLPIGESGTTLARTALARATKAAAALGVELAVLTV